MVQLCRHQQELNRLKVKVLIISFSAPQFAQEWLEEAEVPFTLLLDKDRKVYRQYGLESSFLRSRSPKTLWYYLRKWHVKTKIDKADDPNQLGGDFIVDSQGTLRLVYPSYEPVDRPPVEQLLTILKDCHI